MALANRQAIDIRRLRYFVAVCDHGGISRAASAIGMAQPALTRQIKLLEEEVGLELLVRKGRAARPNGAGRYLVERIRDHLFAVDAVVEELRQNSRDETQEIALGICPTVVPLFLEDLTDFVRVAHPRLKLSVIQAYSGDLRALLECGRLDLALSYRPFERSGLVCEDLVSERLVLAHRRTMANDGDAPLTLDLVKAYRLILPSRSHQLRQIIERIGEQSGHRLTPALELDSLEAVKATLEDTSSDFATILPFHSVKADAESGRFSIRHFEEPEMVRTVSLLMREGRRARRVPSLLTEEIHERARRLRSSLETVF